MVPAVTSKAGTEEADARLLGSGVTRLLGGPVEAGVLPAAMVEVVDGMVKQGECDGLYVLSLPGLFTLPHMWDLN